MSGISQSNSFFKFARAAGAAALAALGAAAIMPSPGHAATATTPNVSAGATGNCVSTATSYNGGFTLTYQTTDLSAGIFTSGGPSDMVALYLVDSSGVIIGADAIAIATDGTYWSAPQGGAGTGPFPVSVTQQPTAGNAQYIIEDEAQSTFTTAQSVGSTYVSSNQIASASFDPVALNPNCQTAVDTTPPNVTSISLLGSPAANAASVNFLVQFDEPVSNVSPGDFGVNVVSGTPTLQNLAVTGTTPDTATLTVTTTDGTAGEFSITLNANTDIVDAAGNGNGTNGFVPAFTGGQTHTVDRVGPQLVSVTRNFPANQTIGSGQSNVGFTMTFDEAVSLASAANGDFVVVPVGLLSNVSGSVLLVQQPSAANELLVVLGNLSGQGEFTVEITGDIDDALGNTSTASTATGTVETFIRDSVAPSGYTIAFDQSAYSAAAASNASVTFAGAEVGTTYSLTITSDNGGTPVTATGTIVTAADQITGLNLTGLNDGTLTVSVTLQDAAGNTGAAVTDTAIKSLSAPPPFSIAFSPSAIPAGGVSTLTHTIDNSTGAGAVSALDFTHALPAGMDVAATPNASTTCTGGTVTAAAGGGSVAYTGGSVSANASCAVTVDVTSATPGTLSATTGDLTSAAGNSGTASGSLTVNAPTLSISNATLSESGSNMVFSVTLSAAIASPVTFDFATADVTATAGTDYQTTTNGNYTIPAGVTQLNVGVPITDDGLDEDDETFTVTISNPTNATLATASGTGTITDDDPTPSLDIASALTVSETGGSATIAVDLSTASGRTVTVDFATSNGTATSGDDYTATSGTLTFAPGDTSETVTVSILDDGLSEGSEQFTVALSNASNATIGTASSTVSITDDEPFPALAISDVTVSEADLAATFTVTLSIASANTITTDVQTVDGTATAGDDYTATTTSLTFAPNETSKLVSVPLLGDAIDEADETFEALLVNNFGATLADFRGEATIQDDDAAPSLSIDDVTVAEGAGTGTFTVSLSAVSGREITVDYTTADGTALAGSDYAAGAGTVTIPAGSPSATIAVSITEDALDENTETFTVDLSNATNASIADASGEASITDNDAPPALSVDDVALAEGDSGATTFTFTVSLDAPSALPITVEASTADGTAVAPSDYTAITGQSVSFAPGVTSQTVDVTVNGDATIEPSEDFTLNLSNPSNATIADGTGTGTIQDDDSLPVLAINSATLSESGTNMVFAVTLSYAVPTPVTFDFATADVTATAGVDYSTITNGNYTIPANVTQLNVGVPVTDDVLDEDDETFTVTISNAVGAAIGTASGTGTITDDDPTPSLSIDDIALAEGDSGTVDFTFTVTLSAASGRTVTVDVDTADQTATAGTDYAAVTGQTLTFTPGQTAQTVTVTVNGDATPESTETFEVNLSNAVNATISDATGLGTIQDDDSVPVGYAVAFDDTVYNAAEATQLGLDVTGATIGATYDYTISDQSSGSVTGSGAVTAAVFTLSNIDVSSLADGQLDVSLTLSNANGAGAAATDSATLDATAPVALAFARQTPAAATTSDDTLVYAITFDGAVLNVTSDDFAITGTTATGVLAGSGSSYTLTLSGGDLASLNGTVGIDLASGQDIADAAGNPLSGTEPATDETYAVTNDVTAPVLLSVLRQSPAAADINGSVTSVTFRFTFDEDLSATPAVSDIGTSIGVVASVTPVTGSSVFDVVISSISGDVIVQAGVVGTVEDLSGNSVTAPVAQTSEQYTRDGTAPSLTILSLFTGTVNAPFQVTFSFDEPVTGFGLGDIAVGNGSASNFAGSGSSYTADITPAADGAVTVDVAAAAAQDAAGNDSQAATQFSINADVTDPTVTLATTATNPVAGPFPLTITFSEDVVSFTASDLVITNGSVVNFLGVGPNNTYTAEIAPTGDGVVTVDLPANAAEDLAGNGNVAATQFSIVADTAPPAVAISTSSTGPVSAAFPVTFTFNEAVTGFTAGDVTVGNGTLSNFAGSGAVYTADVTPGADGPVTVDVAANVAIDIASNGNTAASQFSIDADLTAPSLTILSLFTGTVNAPFQVTFSFDEPVTGFGLGDVVVGNGSASNFAGSGSSYTADITPAADGTVTVDVAAAAAQDAAGNDSQAATQFSINADVTRPDTTLTTTSLGVVNGAYQVTITFTEPVTSFGLSGVQVTNGVASNFAGSGAVYTVDITPAADGAVLVDVPENVAEDSAGNGNLAAAQLSTTADVTAPGLTLTTTVSAPVSAAFPVTFTFTEAVTGFAAGDVTVGNGTLSNFAGSGAVYTADVTPAASGAVTVDVAANAAEDVAGNGNTAATQLSVTADTEAPSLTIGVPGAQVTGAFTATFDFSEPVTGFDIGDIVVTNGAAATLTGSGDAYTVTVTPASLGTVTVAVAAGAAQDAAGNGSDAASASTSAVSSSNPVSLTVAGNVTDPTTVNGDTSITNPGSDPLPFSASADVNWLDVSPNAGTVPSLGSVSLNIATNTNVFLLAPGNYQGFVTVVVGSGSSSTNGAMTTQLAPPSATVITTVLVNVVVQPRTGDIQLIATTPGGVSGDASFTYASDILAFDGLTLTTSGGSASVSEPNVVNGTYVITQSAPAGWRVESISCAGDVDGGSTFNPDTGSATIDLDAGESLVCTFANVRDEDAVRIATQRAIYNFMARRADRLVEAAPDLHRRFSEREATERGAFQADVNGGRYTMALTGSLSGLRNAAAQNQAPGVYNPESPFAQNWDVWFAAEAAGVRDDRAGDDVESDFAVVQLGLDYLVSDRLIVGVLAQYDWMDERSSEVFSNAGATLGAQVEGEGWMAGPYAIWRVRDALTLDVLALYGGSDNTVNPLGFYEDDFETDRFMLRANLTGELRSGAWRLRPQVGITHYEETQTAYTDSLGLSIPEQSLTLGRLRAGPEVAWRDEYEDGGYLELTSRIQALWDYDPADLINEAGLLTSGNDDLRADARFGLARRFGSGMSLRLEAGFSGLGVGDFEATTGRFEIRIPFGGSGRPGAGSPLAESQSALTCENPAGDGFALAAGITTQCASQPGLGDMASHQ
ncbi:MAG: Ig-like domain-containing protein [Alphaproteobacteria bacterium]|nr:Ig-like domain-containing protein [Alphaproteobacteria bacterium]